MAPVERSRSLSSGTFRPKGFFVSVPSKKYCTLIFKRPIGSNICCLRTVPVQYYIGTKLRLIAEMKVRTDVILNAWHTKRMYIYIFIIWRRVFYWELNH